MSTATPVLFLIFNRPDHTRRVFERIREARPSQLFISADGPREHVASDPENCRLARQIAGQVDWPCELNLNFSDRNLGCRRAVQSGIDWFFGHVEAGIILEDDCLPSSSFFTYCTDMLRHHADDERVMHISGSNPATGACCRTGSDYVFSRFSFIWGWATWRRAWKQYNDTFTGLEEYQADITRMSSLLVQDTTACRYLLDKFQRTRDGEIDTWDYGWFYTILTRGGWCATPTVNLIENIGFDHTATHTSFSFRKPERVQASLSGPIRHPAGMVRSESIEQAFFKNSQKGYWGLMMRRLAPGLFFKTRVQVSKPVTYKPALPAWMYFRQKPVQHWG
ncbi:MAG: hypothetical protein KDC70_15925 [Saprospiraceae bacterium]|nr:hypothetical protein [Saprospiraceae bacterium]